MKIATKPFFFACILFVLMMQIVLQEKIGFLQYVDEFVAILSLLYITIKILSGNVEKRICIDFVIILIIFSLGLIGTIVFKNQTNRMAIITDIGNLFKAFVSFYAFYISFKNKDNWFNEKLIKYLSTFCKMVILPGFLLSIVNLFYNIGMYTDYTYGIRSFHYIFLRVGNLYSFCVMSLIILTLNLKNDTHKTGDFLFIVLTIILMISTLRTRAFLFALLYVMGYLYFIKEKKIKIKLRYIILFLAIALYIALPKINHYYVENTNTARYVLVEYGIITARDYYPIGAGYGTYGTYAAKEYYSPLYYRYNFNQYHGLSENYGAFLTDDYWPAILGEFGFIGVILMIILLTRILIILITSKNAKSKFGSLFGYIVLLMSSLVTGSFFSTSSVVIMILVAIAYHYNNSQAKRERVS